MKNLLKYKKQLVKIFENYNEKSILKEFGEPNLLVLHSMYMKEQEYLYDQIFEEVDLIDFFKYEAEIGEKHGDRH